MKKKISFKSAVLSFMTCLLFALTIGTVGAMNFEADFVSTTIKALVIPTAVMTLHYVTTGKTLLDYGAANMAIAQEFWGNYIIDNLFKDDSFIQYCFDESDYVLAGAIVHIPQAGAKPTVVKNRSSFPATAVRRTDTDITYTLDDYTTDPTHITDAEANEISYEKASSVFGEHVDTLGNTIGDDLLIKWAPTTAATILRTTGGDVATALAPSATGTRKKFLKEDLKEAARKLDGLNIPSGDRYALMPSDIYYQLIEDADLIKRDGVAGGELNLGKGVIMELYGFKLMKRSNVLVYDNAGTPAPKALGAAGAAADNMAVLCWHKNAVAKALGAVTMYQDKGNPMYYGDIYSGRVKMGGRKRRTNAEGVVAIVQSA